MNSDQENFKNLFNAIHDFLFILDLNGNIIETNNAVHLFLGYSKEELHGKSVLIVHPPEYRVEAGEIVQSMLAGKSEKCPLPLLAKDGRHVPVETRIYFGKWNGENVLLGISRNLSEIAISEEKFYRVFENCQAMMAIAEINSGVFINVNKVFLKTMEYEESEVLGNTSKNLNIFLNYDQRLDLVRRIKNKEVIENENVIVRTKSGKQLQCLFSAALIKIQTYQYMLTSAIDISSLKETEQKLITSLSHQKMLAEISQLFLSIDGLSEKVNTALNLLGKTLGVSRICIFKDNSHGTETSDSYEWCKPGINAHIQQLQRIPVEKVSWWQRVFNNDEKVFSGSIESVPEDIRQSFALQDLKSLLVFPLYIQNRITGCLGFGECSFDRKWEPEELELLRTISGIISNSFERQNFQQQLSESELRLKMAIDNTEAGLWDWNIQTGEVYFNNLWCTMLGYSQNEIEPNVKSWERLVHPDDMPYVMENINKHLCGESDGIYTNHRLLTKSGKWKWIIDKGKIIEYDSDHKPLRAIGTHIDIDHQKDIEAELRKLNETKDKMFSIIAHDLRGPISSMMQISEMIAQKGLLNEEELQISQNAQKELSQSTYDLLENLLSWARYNSDQILVNPSAFILNEIVDDVLKGVKYSAKQKGISIIKNFTGRFEVYADENMIRIVMRNLLSNAVKFTDRSGMVNLDLQRDGNHVKIKLCDTGIGITAQNIGKILSENQFFTTFGTAKEKGTGLGLKLCKNLVVMNKGEFSINSEPGKGSCFTFTLPIMHS